MRQNHGLLIVASAILLSAGPALRASDHYKVLNGPDRMYFGHISYVDIAPGGRAPSVFREGAAGAEDAVVNLPIGPGDTVRTGDDSRCEIQFDTGTVIRLDHATELRVETVLAQSLSGPQQVSNLTLTRGRIYVMYKEFDRREMFQALTPNAALKLKHNTVAMVTSGVDGATDVQVKHGKASVLYGSGEEAKSREVGKAQRLILVGEHQAQTSTYIPSTDFELWNDDINARFDELHKGQSTLPEALQTLPKAVFYFAQQFGNHFGEWLWDEYYGYVWRPFVSNGVYPWGGWQPYFYGRWSMAGGRMYWVPEEPWGWIPYHLGIWQWDKKLGWVWLPGSMFAEAWVDWEFFFGYAGWRPWSLYDWFALCDPFYGPMAFGFRFYDSGWLYGAWPYGPSEGGGVPPGWKMPVRKITPDMLKQPQKTTTPLPKEMKTIVGRVLTAYKNGDPRITESVGRVPAGLRFVAKDDLRTPKVQEAAMPFERVPRFDVPAAGSRNGVLDQPAHPGREAARIFRVTGGRTGPAVLAQKGDDVRGADGPATQRRPASAGGDRALRTNDGPSLTGAPRAPAVAVRQADGDRSPNRPAHLDWNPDVRIARALSAHIEYSPGKNEIRCPEFRLTSGDRDRTGGYVPSLTRSGVSYTPASSVSSGVSTASPNASSSAGQGRASSGGASKESSGGGGKIKN